MIDHTLLNRELVGFAATLTHDFDVSEQLHQVSITAAAALNVDGAGVTLRMPTGDTNFLSATDPATMHVERQQDALMEGACIDAPSAGPTCARSSGHDRGASRVDPRRRVRLLRTHSRSRRMKLHAVAEAVVQRGVDVTNGERQGHSSSR